jgi:H+/Cl- antiporter ClcA
MTINSRLRSLFISILVGVIAGALSAFFLFTLNLVTNYRIDHDWMIWLLPVAGFAVGLMYHSFGRSVEAGNNLILDEIHEPNSQIPFRMIPLVITGTWITHLFGGSAGREGTAIQMGATAADQLAKRFQLSSDERSTILMAGMSAGFGSVFGVPFAGALFGIEVLSIGNIRFRRVLECLVASFTGYAMVLILGVQHTHYTSPLLPEVTLKVLGSVIVAGTLFGLTALAFATATHSLSSLFKRFISYAPLRPLIGGLAVVVGFYFLGTFRYAGLGVPVIEDSLRQPLSVLDFIYKSVFTVVTLGSGMKGGEVTPLLFIGSTLGNALGSVLPIGFSVLAALGFVGVFAGAANTPLACTLMAMEIFGPGIGLLALVACYASWMVSGHRGIYSSQRISRYKPTFLRPRIRR